MKTDESEKVCRHCGEAFVSDDISDFCHRCETYIDNVRWELNQD